MFCIQQLCNGIHLHMSACKCTFTLSIQKTIWSLYITAFIICVLKAYKLIAYILAIFRVMLGLIVKEACPVGSCPATMVVAVHSPKGGRVAPAIQVMVDPSASIAAMKAVPPSPAGMEGCALKKQASRTFTASVPVAGQGNGVRTSCPTSLKYPYALSQTVVAKPKMMFATRNVTLSFVTGTAGTVLLHQKTPGLNVHNVGVSLTTASVMSPATTLIVCMTTLTV